MCWRTLCAPTAEGCANAGRLPALQKREAWQMVAHFMCAATGLVDPGRAMGQICTFPSKMAR